MPPAAHAVFSASASARRIGCPGSLRLEEQFPDQGSRYAAAGTLAHAICELKATKYFIEPIPPRTFNARLRKLKKDESYDPRMDEASDMYLDYLKEQAMTYDAPPFVALETRVDFSQWVPEGFGTADCIMIGSGRMGVYDYKNGVTPVEAEGNSQMMIYALGALSVYAPIFGDTIQTIHMAIIQPNAGGIKEWDISKEVLLGWAENVLRPAAELALSDHAPIVPDSNPDGYCKFCKARHQCTARAKMMLELEDHSEMTGDLMTDDELGQVLQRAAGFASWLKGLQDYALSAALAGRQITGFKVVEGRGSRDWTDLDKAFDTLKSRGVEDAMLWERKPVTVAGLEKALGKKVFGEVSEGIVEKKRGKPTLVPESDKRPPYNAPEIAFQEVP